jgi:hypothetical protein
MKNVQTEMRQTAATLLEALDAFDAFDADAFNEIPCEKSWTAGQVSEHLLKAAAATRVVHGKTAPTWRKPDEKVEMLRHVFLDMNTKFQSPDFIVPGNGPFVYAEMRSALQNVWVELIAEAGELDLSVTCTDLELPVFGLLTRLEWISFYMVHTQRHIQQLHRICSALSKRPISQ